MRSDIEALIVEDMHWMKLKANYFCGVREDAEDLVCDTICKLLVYADNFHIGEAFRPWALTVMQSIYVNWYNRRRRVLFTSLGEYDCESNIGADQSVALRQVFSIIRKCARNSRCVECVVLFAKGYTYEEISCSLGIPIGTVKSRVNAGRKLLAEALE